MKHHLLAKFINDLRDTAVKFKDTHQLRSQLKNTVSNYMDVTIDDDCSLINEWQIQDKNVLASALREIYANNGEDQFIKMTCLKALTKTGSNLPDRSGLHSPFPPKNRTCEFPSIRLKPFKSRVYSTQPLISC